MPIDIAIGTVQVLKSWLGMKLMWNPYRNTTALIAHFASGYYSNAAAPYIQKHIEIFVNSARSKFLTLHVSYTSAYLSPLACLSALDNLRQAAQAVKISAVAADSSSTPSLSSSLPIEVVLSRLETIRMGLMYIVLLRWDEMQAWAASNNYTWPWSGGIRSKYEQLSKFTS
eukprot:SAG11_NODE_13194_length_666_cov_0.728395_1_plen_170_part_10